MHQQAAKNSYKLHDTTKLQGRKSNKTISRTLSSRILLAVLVASTDQMPRGNKWNKPG